jgi:hypothetical protein
MAGKRSMANVVEMHSGTDTPSNAHRSLFPLKLSAFEKFLFWDDCPEQPYTSFFEFNFTTTLNETILRESISRVLAHNPLLSALIKEENGDLYWVISTETVRWLDIASEPPMVSGSPRPIDLTREVGCRFWYRPMEHGSQLIMQVHHCVCDGIAMRSVLIDVLHLYALATDSSSQTSNVGEKSMLFDRYVQTELNNRSDFSHLGQPRRALGTWQRIKNARYFHFQPPKPLCGQAQSSSEAQLELNPLCHLNLGAELSEKVLGKAQREMIGMSELSVALLFRTCASWNQEHGDNNSRSRLRLLVPYDLRGRIDLRMPATNRMTFAFLGRSYQQCKDRRSLIASVQQEFVDIKDTHLGLDFLNALEAGARYPRLMKWVLRNSRHMATAVITYAGDVSRGMSKLFPEVEGQRVVGDARLESIFAAPPVRQNTNVALGLCINWGKICISASFNRKSISRAQCEQFLELYRTEWERFCE